VHYIQATAKAAPEGAGDTWTWTAIDADSKLIVSYLVGGRDAECASEFVHDLRSCLRNRVQLTSDGLKNYLTAVEDAFGDEVGYPQLVKIMATSPRASKAGTAPANAAARSRLAFPGAPTNPTFRPATLSART
jgi:hypothetical protein